MQPPISEICFVGVYGHEQNDFLRAGLESRGVTVTDAGFSTRQFEWTILGRRIPLYPMKPTLNWFGDFPNAILPIFFLLTFLIHSTITWAGLLANIGAVRRTDAIVVPHLGDTSVLSVKPLTVLLGTPLVYISHNGMYFTLVENREAYRSRFAAGFIYVVDRLVQEWADRIVVLSHHSKSVLSESFGLPEAKYDVVYLAVDDSQFRTSRELDENDAVDVLYWGNFIPHHSVSTMVDAAAELPDCRFVFAGRSAERDAIQARASRLDVENITFPGFVSNAILGAYIRDADVILGPLGDFTQTRMNIGTKVAEACAMRKAVVLADHPAPNEVFEHRSSAMLIPPENVAALVAAIRTVRSDGPLRTRIESGGREVYEKQFSPESAATAFIEVVADATNG